MRLVSYNVRYFGHELKGLASTSGAKARIAQALASLTPLADVIALQEVETRSLRASTVPRSAHPAETQLEAFLRHLRAAFERQGQALPYTAYYYPAHVYRLGPLKLYTTGLAVLVHTHTVHVVQDNAQAPRQVTHRPAFLKQLKQTRIAAHLHLELLGGQRLHLFNTHLSLPTPFARDFWAQERRMGFGKNQLAEAQAALDYARHTAGAEPFLLVGDFNSAPASPVYDLLTGELTGAQAALGQVDMRAPNAFPTAGFMRLKMHLDHVFGSRGITFTDVSATRRFGDEASPFHGLSDHIPLIATAETE